MKAIILSLMLLLPKVIHAQVSEGYKSSIAFNLGYQKNYLQDNLFSPPPDPERSGQTIPLLYLGL